MSEAARAYVEALAKGNAPAGCAWCGAPVRLGLAERQVLKCLAFHYNDLVGCAWPGYQDMAAFTTLSTRQVQRVVDKLVRFGLVRIFDVVRTDGSRASNEFEFPRGMVSTAGATDVRRQVMKYTRDRVEQQEKLFDAKQLSMAGRRGDGRVRVPEWMLHGRGLCSPGAHVEESCGLLVGDVVGAHDIRCRGGHDTRCHPVKVSEESRNVDPFPFSFPCGDEAVEKNFPVSGEVSAVRADAEQHVALAETQRATAKAKATTERADAAAVRHAKRGGEFGASPGAAAVDRLAMDGEAAALWDEVTRVLVACGVAPDDSTRRERRAVQQALELHVVRSRCSIAQAGDLMITRWGSFSTQLSFMTRKLGLRRFVAEGLWLNVHAWPLDQRRWDLAREAAVGVRWN